MSDANGPARTGARADIAGRITELKVSGNLMTLDAGLFCLYQQPGQAPPPADGSGLPGVRISVPPRMHAGAPAARGEVTIRGLHDDGWLGPRDGAALVRVSGGPAQILITVYQSPEHPPECAPRLQVVPLTASEAPARPGDARRGAPEPAALAKAAVSKAAPPRVAHDVLAHIQRTGDVGVGFGQWLGKPGSGAWIEGFAITPQAGLSADDFEYQAVLGRGWLSPWISGGKFCGSRGMALPMLGFNLRLRGKAAERFACEYQASFLDGTRIGPVAAGKSCEAASLSPLEALRIVLHPRDDGRTGAKRAVKPPGKTAAKPAAKPVAKPVAKPAARPAARSAAKASPKPSARPAAKPAAKPARKSAAGRAEAAMAGAKPGPKRGR